MVPVPVHPSCLRASPWHVTGWKTQSGQPGVHHCRGNSLSSALRSWGTQNKKQEKQWEKGMQPDSLSAGAARSTLALCALPKKTHQGHEATCQGLHRETGPLRCPKFSQFGVCHPSPSAGHTLATGSFTTRCKFTFSSNLPQTEALQRLTVSSNSLHLRQEPASPSFYLFFSSR